MGEEHVSIFFAVSSVISEIWAVAIWQPLANTGTKLAKIKSYIERLV